MINPLRRRATRRPRDERGVEATAMLIVIPVLFVLVIALIDIGMSLRNRMMVENIARDAVRGVAADGGNYNPRTMSNFIDHAGGWDAYAKSQLWNGYKCTMKIRCTQPPEVNCTPDVVDTTGQIVTCTVKYYPKAINAPLLNSALGLGMGNLVPDEITITAQARAETGRN